MVKKKTCNYLLTQKRSLIERGNQELSINRQLELINLSKSSYYYNPIPETPLNLTLMEFIDKVYLKYPFYGSRRMTAVLKNEGFNVNRKRVIRLMKLIGIKAIYPQPKLSKRNEINEKYSYLLNGINVTEPNHVWSSDITYIPLKNSFLYLTVIIDWATRYVLSWRLSNTMDVHFCIETIEEALKINQPKIFNSDHGSQYTSKEFLDILKKQNVKISMNGKGRCLDNIFVERFWRSIKYEEVYLKRYETCKEAHQGLDSYIKFYNTSRPHQSLNYKTPKECYFGMV